MDHDSGNRTMCPVDNFGATVVGIVSIAIDWIKLHQGGVRLRATRAVRVRSHRSRVDHMQDCSADVRDLVSMGRVFRQPRGESCRLPIHQFDGRSYSRTGRLGSSDSEWNLSTLGDLLGSTKSGYLVTFDANCDSYTIDLFLDAFRDFLRHSEP
jgi:hypothetical protein